ncbi:RING finger protein 17-like isoform X2 [Choristoneura fumiferana]|uniref:RING finger protein 17-like isoform X2 n=1 Tax=Choristoneura fumiferana TaxID=7141 RepID=UPI003D154CE9
MYYGQCLECQIQTTKLCQQCNTIICQECFDKSHKSFVVFKTHVLKEIQAQKIPNNCLIHIGKSLDYYCRDCKKSVCLDCLMIGSEKSCKRHDIVLITEMNAEFLDDLREVSVQVDTIFRRLTKTAVDIGYLLQKVETEKPASPDLEQVTITIEQHFSKLSAEILTHKREVLGIIEKLKDIEKDSLVKAKHDVAKAIKDSNNVMSSLKTALSCQENTLVNVSTLLNDAKNILTKPWYLSRDESNKLPLKVTVNDDLCMLISDYIQLEGNAKAQYKLRASHELDGYIPPPPLSPVFPPLLLKDAGNKNIETAQCGIPQYEPEFTIVNGTNEILQALNATNKNGETANERPPDAKEIPKCGPEIILNGANDDQQTPVPECQKPVVDPVSKPLPNNYLRPLRPGKKELVVITHMEDLDEFYIQRAIEESTLHKMTEELQPNLKKIEHKDISIDGMYVVRSDTKFMRCQVYTADDSDANDPTYYVTCLDFGCTLPVKLKDLRDAPSTFAVGSPEGRYPTPLAIRCRLANCKPKDGVWTKRDVDFVRQIIDNKPVTIEISHIGAHVACDVTTADGTSIAHALAFHSRAVLLQPNLPYPESKGLTEKPKLYLSNTNLKWKSHADVYISYVESPERFFVREKSLDEDFNKLSHNLNQSYSLSDTSGSVYLPEIGLVCVVHVSTEKKEQIGIDYSGWARAIVKSIGEGVVNVFLPDVGCCLEVEWHHLRRIKQKFTEIRGLSSECYLAGLQTEWCEDATDQLNSYKGRLLKLKVDKKHERKTVGAILFWKSEQGNVCINEKVAAYIVDEANEFENSGLMNVSDKSVEKISEVEPSSSTNLAEVTSPELPKMPKLVQKESGSLRLEAKILYYESPALIYVTVIPQQKTFNMLFEDIQKFYSKRKSTRRGNWKINDRCCALCIQSVTWRRATILDLKKDSATVFYTDFACTETIPISNLKKLHPDFEDIGNAAIKCHLAGVKPTEGQEWPSQTIEFLKEKLDSYKRIFITRVGPFEDKSMPIELWVYHTDQGSALEPDKSEWRCLNKAIIKQNLAVSDINCLAGNESCEGEMSFLNLTSGSDWLQVPPMRDTQVSPGASSSSSTLAGYNINSENTLFISDWLPAEPLKCTAFTGMPTYIDNDGIIYLHDVSQEHVLEFIKDTLAVGSEKEYLKAQSHNWRVGEPCVARYYLDDSFYRGTVVKVDKEQLQCTIQYVDYGNYEECAFSDLRKGIALHQIPIQAHACLLSRIGPIGGQWDLPELDYIHKAIVEKKCFVKVTGEPIDGIVPIDLKYDKLWINDHLVEFNMAIYTDGSKPIVRQFVPIKGKVVKTERTIKVNTASEPDYIVEEIGSSGVSGSPDSFKMHTLTDPRNETYKLTETNANFLSYPRREETEFDCNITVINNTNTLELIVNLGEKNRTYEKLYETVQNEGDSMPPLTGIFENKACIALFSEDNKWYRAIILQYSESKNLVKVRYVDYGNMGIIALQNVREINEDWVKLPPASLSVTLHNVKVNPNFHHDDIMSAFANTFLDKGLFHVKIIHYKNSLPCVELRDNKQALVYQEMFASMIFLNDKCNHST